jgi:CDGSH-type Zn-finger protein
MTNPEIPSKIPYVVDCKPGTYAWCSCGKSQKQPYCDGSHKGLPK